MRDAKDISDYIELIAHAKTQDEALSMAESAAKQIGFNWFSIGAEDPGSGRLRLAYDRLPPGCYKTYLQAFCGATCRRGKRAGINQALFFYCRNCHIVGRMRHNPTH